MSKLITETGYDYSKTYWCDKGKFKKVKAAIDALIPNQGEAATDELNLYRVVSNLYYDLYNNGLGNKDIRLPIAAL